MKNPDERISEAPTRLQIDPILFKVIRNSLAGAVDEMGAALQRSAYSTKIKTRGDFSCMFFDRRLRAVAQAFTQPIHLGGLFHLVPTVIRKYGQDRLAPGDAILTNHPFFGGVHLNAEHLAMLDQTFHQLHERAYGHSAPGEPVQIVNLRLTARGSIPKPRMKRLSPAKDQAEVAAKGMRPVCFRPIERNVRVPMRDGVQLAADIYFPNG